MITREELIRLVGRAESIIEDVGNHYGDPPVCLYEYEPDSMASRYRLRKRPAHQLGGVDAEHAAAWQAAAQRWLADVKSAFGSPDPEDGEI